MRLLDRNKQTVYYRNYIGMTPIMADGLETGEYTKSYGLMQSVQAYVKSAIGNNAAEPFGDFTDKQRVIYLKDTDINEFTLIWVGVDPNIDERGEPTVPHNFTVSGVAKGLNHYRISIRKVEVNG